MKTTNTPKIYEVRALRGFTGEDGKNVKVGQIIKCKINFAKTLQAIGRGEIVEPTAK